MRAVHLTRKLILEDRVQTPDGSGGFDDSWVQLGQLWAEVRAGTGNEGQTDNAHLSRVPYQITVRAAPFGSPSRPQPDQRFTEGPRVFKILAVSEKDPHARFLVCHAFEEEVA